MFKLQKKNLHDEGLNYIDDGPFTNKNSMIGSWIGTRRATEDGDCDVPTPSDELTDEEHNIQIMHKESGINYKS